MYNYSPWSSQSKTTKTAIYFVAIKAHTVNVQLVHHLYSLLRASYMTVLICFRKLGVPRIFHNFETLKLKLTNHHVNVVVLLYKKSS